LPLSVPVGRPCGEDREQLPGNPDAVEPDLVSRCTASRAVAQVELSWPGGCPAHEILGRRALADDSAWRCAGAEFRSPCHPLFKSRQRQKKSERTARERVKPVMAVEAAGRLILRIDDQGKCLQVASHHAKRSVGQQRAAETFAVKTLIDCQ